MIRILISGGVALCLILVWLVWPDNQEPTVNSSPTVKLVIQGVLNKPVSERIWLEAGYVATNPTCSNPIPFTGLSLAKSTRIIIPFKRNGDTVNAEVYADLISPGDCKWTIGSLAIGRGASIQGLKNHELASVSHLLPHPNPNNPLPRPKHDEYGCNFEADGVNCIGSKEQNYTQLKNDITVRRIK